VFFILLFRLSCDINSGSRNEIASCEEAAYESLPLKDAATLLFFTNQSELLTFAQKVFKIAADITFTKLHDIPARLAGRSHFVYDHIQASRRGKNGNTQTAAHSRIPSICKRIGTDRVII